MSDPELVGLLNAEGYPSDEAIDKIRHWPYSDSIGLMEFIKSLWWAAAWGWHQSEGNTKICYDISTGGWSGNEEIIRALQSNIFWPLCWVSSRCGGHYSFEIEKQALEDK